MNREQAAEGTGSEPRFEFEAVFRDNGSYVWRVLRRLGVSEGDLPDMCQNVFLIVHRKLHQFEGRASIRTWLYRICIRVAADYRKRAHRRYEQPAEAWHAPATPPRQARCVTLCRMAEALERALEALPDAPRRVFVLYEFEELPMDEVAEVLGCPVKTAYSRLYSARRRVGEALQEAGWRGGLGGLALLVEAPGHWSSFGELSSALRACHDVLPTTQPLASLGAKATGVATSAKATGFATSAKATGFATSAKATAGWLAASALAVSLVAPIGMPAGAVLARDARPDSPAAGTATPRLALPSPPQAVRQTDPTAPEVIAPRGRARRSPVTPPSPPQPAMALVRLPPSMASLRASAPAPALSFDLDTFLNAAAPTATPAVLVGDAHPRRPLGAARPADGWLDRSLEGDGAIRDVALLQREIALVKRVVGQMRKNDPRRPDFLLRLSRLYQELERHHERVVRSLDEDIACACHGLT